MKRIECLSCSARIDGTPAFCARCGEPTRFATADERTQHELEKWRRSRHQSEQVASVRAGVSPPAESPAARATDDGPIRTRAAEEGATVLRRARASLPSSADPGGHGHGNGDTRTKRRNATLRAVLARRAPRDLHTEAPSPSPADPFAYRACVSCQRVDWLLRTGRNEDGSFRYWCLRCSRSFKTDVWLAHAVKPFVVGGSILVALAVLANFH